MARWSRSSSRALLRGLQIGEDELPDRWRQENWPAIAARFEAAFAAKNRDAWAEVFAGTDACVTPMLSLAEAPAHPHHVARAAFAGQEPSPSPRFSRTPAERGAPLTGEGEAALAARGVTAERIAALKAAGAM